MGFHAVRTALELHPRRVERLLLARDQRDHRTRRLIALARAAGVPFQPTPRDALDRLSPTAPHQGVVARWSAADLLREDELLTDLPPAAFVLVLDGVQDPRNLGAVLRSAAAFGVDGVFLPGRRSAGLSPATARTAAGGVELTRVARAGNLSRLLEALDQKGITPTALDVAGDTPPWAAVLTGGVALVVGSEEAGVRRSVLGRCKTRIGIPLRPGIGALNVSVAVGIVLAEAHRQRQGGGCGR